MENIFIHKHTHEEVNLIHMGKMKISNETVAIYEMQIDKTIMVMPLSEFNHDYHQNDYTDHVHFTES